MLESEIQFLKLVSNKGIRKFLLYKIVYLH